MYAPKVSGGKLCRIYANMYDPSPLNEEVIAFSNGASLSNDEPPQTDIERNMIASEVYFDTDQTNHLNNLGYDHCIIIYNINTKQIDEIYSSVDQIRSIRYTPDEKHIVSLGTNLIDALYKQNGQDKRVLVGGMYIHLDRSSEYLITNDSIIYHTRDHSECDRVLKFNFIAKTLKSYIPGLPMPQLGLGVDFDYKMPVINDFYNRSVLCYQDKVFYINNLDTFAREAIIECQGDKMKMSKNYTAVCNKKIISIYHKNLNLSRVFISDKSNNFIKFHPIKNILVIISHDQINYNPDREIIDYTCYITLIDLDDGYIQKISVPQVDTDSLSFRESVKFSNNGKYLFFKHRGWINIYEEDQENYSQRMFEGVKNASRTF